MKDKNHRDTDLVTCDICGRATHAADISWEEDTNERMCRQCRAEEESCGCSDYQV